MKKPYFVKKNSVIYILAGAGGILFCSLSSLLCYFLYYELSYNGLRHETIAPSLFAGTAAFFSAVVFALGFFLIRSISRIKHYESELRNCKIALHHMGKKATTDKLTRLFNRSYLEPYIDSQLEYSQLYSQPLSIIMIDIDQFKYINDTFGHAAGDHILIQFSEIILSCTRRTDLVARYGGDEFIVILPETGNETALSIAERIRQSTNEANFPPYDSHEFPSLSCSLGISTYPIHCNSSKTLLKTSDAALYKAKNSGRNCVKVYNQD